MELLNESLDYQKKLEDREFTKLVIEHVDRIKQLHKDLKSLIHETDEHPITIELFGMLCRMNNIGTAGDMNMFAQQVRDVTDVSLLQNLKYNPAEETELEHFKVPSFDNQLDQVRGKLNVPDTGAVKP